MHPSMTPTKGTHLLRRRRSGISRPQNRYWADKSQRPTYFLKRQADAHRVIEVAAKHNLLVQMVLFHVQIVKGDLAGEIHQHIKTLTIFK